MNKRTCPAPVLYKVTQLQMAQVWVTEMTRRIPGVFLSMSHETYNMWASLPCSEMGCSKYRREASIFLAEEGILSLMCYIPIVNRCGYEDVCVRFRLSWAWTRTTSIHSLITHREISFVKKTQTFIS